MKYRLWQFHSKSAWDFEDKDDMMYVTKWREFLESNNGRLVVPNWQLQLTETTKYIDSDTLNLDDAIEKDNEEICEEWMYLTKLVEPE